MSETRIKNIPSWLWRRIKILAIQQGMTVNDFLIKMLLDKIKKED